MESTVRTWEDLAVYWAECILYVSILSHFAGVFTSIICCWCSKQCCKLRQEEHTHVRACTYIYLESRHWMHPICPFPGPLWLPFPVNLYVYIPSFWHVNTIPSYPIWGGPSSSSPIFSPCETFGMIPKVNLVWTHACLHTCLCLIFTRAIPADIAMALPGWCW